MKKHPFLYSILFLLVLETAFSASAQFSLTIRRVVEPPESGGQQSAMQQSSSSLQNVTYQANLSYDRAPRTAEDLPYPWNPRFHRTESYRMESSLSASLAPPGGGDGGGGTYSLLTFDVTNSFEITASSLLPEKLYQLLVASNVTGPYLPESDPVEALDSSYTWLTTNSNPTGFYLVQEIVPPCPPTVSITSPSDGAVANGYDDIFISATAAACPTNRILRAVLFDNGRKVGWLTSSETNLIDLTFQVSTKHLAYGSHSFTVMVEDDALPENGEHGYVAYSAPVSVTVTNPIWFVGRWGDWETGDVENSINDRIPIIYGSVIDDVRITTTIRDSQGVVRWEYFGDALPGLVEANGGRFFYTSALNFADGNGGYTHAPDPYYEMTVTVTRRPAQGLEAAEDDEPIVQIVKGFFREYVMPSTTNAEAIVAWQVTFGTNHQQAAAAIEDLDAIRERFSEVYYNPLPAGDSEADRLSTTAEWTMFLNALTNWYCRTLVYFGHAGESAIGEALPQGASASFIRNRLGNFGPFNQTTNFHPYRALLLFGCNTAKESGNLIEAFLGIKQTEPKSPADRYTLFDVHRLKPRAALGFTGYKFGTLGLGINTPHHELYEGAKQLTAVWAETFPAGGYRRSLQQAVKDSKIMLGNNGFPNGVKNPAANGERIVGDDRIKFQ